MDECNNGNNPHPHELQDRSQAWGETAPNGGFSFVMAMEMWVSILCLYITVNTKLLF